MRGRLSPLERRRCVLVLAALQGVIGPEQARGDGAPGAPGFGEFDHRFGTRPLVQIQGIPHRML